MPDLFDTMFGIPEGWHEFRKNDVRQQGIERIEHEFLLRVVGKMSTGEWQIWTQEKKETFLKEFLKMTFDHGARDLEASKTFLPPQAVEEAMSESEKAFKMAETRIRIAFNFLKEA